MDSIGHPTTRFQIHPTKNLRFPKLSKTLMPRSPEAIATPAFTGQPATYFFLCEPPRARVHFFTQAKKVHFVVKSTSVSSWLTSQLNPPFRNDMPHIWKLPAGTFTHNFDFLSAATFLAGRRAKFSTPRDRSQGGPEVVFGPIGPGTLKTGEDYSKIGQ